MVVGSDSSGLPVTADGAQSQNTSGSQETPTLPRIDQRANSQAHRGGGEQAQATLGTGTPPSVDSAAVSDQLFAILETIDFGNPTQTNVDSMRRHATRVHDDARVPTNLRAEAAHLVATLFDLDDNKAVICVWFVNELDFVPGGYVFVTLRDLFFCR